MPKLPTKKPFFLPSVNVMLLHLVPVLTVTKSIICSLMAVVSFFSYIGAAKTVVLSMALR